MLLIGAAGGCYASFIAGKVVVWLNLKHDFFYQIELLSALINRDSIETRPGKYPLWRILEAKAIEFCFYGHDKAYRECHRIADEIQRIFPQVAVLENPNYYEISSQKTEWMRCVAALKPNWKAFFSPKRDMNSVLEFYLSKEGEYLRLFKSNITSRGGNVSDLPDSRM
jgi:hypothetical protein